MMSMRKGTSSGRTMTTTMTSTSKRSDESDYGDCLADDATRPTENRKNAETADLRSVKILSTMTSVSMFAEDRASSGSRCSDIWEEEEEDEEEEEERSRSGSGLGSGSGAGAGAVEVEVEVMLDDDDLDLDAVMADLEKDHRIGQRGGTKIPS